MQSDAQFFIKGNAVFQALLLVLLLSFLKSAQLPVPILCSSEKSSKFRNLAPGRNLNDMLMVETNKCI
jgi:hypothetical protein